MLVFLIIAAVLRLCSAFLLESSYGSQEFLKPMATSFESKQAPGGWGCLGSRCVAQRVRNPHTGNYSLKISNRRNSQSVTHPLSASAFTSGKSFAVSGFVKLLDKRWKDQSFSLTVTYNLAGRLTRRSPVATIFEVSAARGWMEISGDFTVPVYEKPITGLTLMLTASGTAGFAMDDFSLKEITNSNWEEEAKERIEKIRKDDLTITVKSKSANYKNITVEVDQISHEFGFGTAVKAELLNSNAAYRKWYMDNFEWAVFENDMKWRQTEAKGQGKFKYEAVDAAMDLLQKNAKKVRGHTVFWAGKKNNPDWVQAITNGTELYEVCMKRAKDVVTRYKGRIEQWDVINEMVTNDFYKSVYGSDQIRYDLFNEVQKLDPNAKLFLNDFAVVNKGIRTQAYANMAKRFSQLGVPVDGIGAQGHFYDKPIGPVIHHRLNTLASAGLPIWITELDYGNSNTRQRALGLQEAMTAFFSHPSVKGVLLWGFWDQAHFKGSDAALATGDDLKTNSAGWVWRNLLHKHWRSIEKISMEALKKGEMKTSKVSVFHGEHKVVVSADGKVLKIDKISVLEETGPVSFTIDLE